MGGGDQNIKTPWSPFIPAPLFCRVMFEGYDIAIDETHWLAEVPFYKLYMC